MENQGHPGTKKSKKNLKIFLNGNSPKTSLDSRFEIVQSNSATVADVEIDYFETSVKLKSDLFHSENETNFSHQNCLSLLNLLELKKNVSYQLKNRSGHHVVGNRSIPIQLKKLDQSLLKLFKKLPISNYKSLSSIIKDDLRLYDLHIDSLSVHTFLSNLFELSFFVNFTTIQLMIHEKGKNEAENHAIFKSGKYKKATIPATAFSQAYQSIKKSKTKIFNNSQLQQNHIEVLGPFLAKEFELQNSSAILIFSRDEFLPITEDDNRYLNGIVPAIKSILLSLVVKAKFSDRQKTLLCSINFFPEPIVVKVAGNIIFKNKAYLSTSFEKSQNPKVLKIGQDKEVLIWLIESEDTITDLGHFQRVSLLGELLNTLKHELSNPLFGLSLSSQLLQMGTQHNEAKDFLTSISESTNRCNEIIMNFSNFYLDSEKSKKVYIEKIVQEVFTLSKSETRGIHKSLHFIDGLDTFTEIETNPTLISQILFNLIVNSAQAIADKVTQPSIKVVISKTETDLIISVSDNGPDLEINDLENLFKPFFTTKKNGTGLGLSICRKLAKRLGGSLRYSSNKPFPGLTFSLVLPN